MKAAFVTDVEKVEVKEIEKPVITDTEVLIKAKTVGVCGSDLHLFLSLIHILQTAAGGDFKAGRAH